MAFPDIKKIPPKSIYVFRDVSEDDEIHIPEIAENRKITDCSCLFLFVTALSIMICLVVYTALDSDYYRFVNGYDKCGDTCGVKNPPISKINCSGKNLGEKPYMNYAVTGKIDERNVMLPDECVDLCDPPNELLFQRCIFPIGMVDKKGEGTIYLMEFFHDFHKSRIIFLTPMIIAAVVSSVVLLLSLHSGPYITVKLIFILTFMGLFCSTGYIWYWFLDDTKYFKEFVYIGMVLSIAIFFLALFICYFHDKYRLVVDMFVEATEITFKIPTLMLVPVVILLILFIVFTGMIFLTPLLLTNQSLKKVQNNPPVYEYFQTQLSQHTVIYLIFMALWLLSFANGCQCIIVAGPVSAYYFQRDKSTIHYSVSASCYMLCRYHLGTVALGSLCITIVTVARVILNFLENQVKRKCALKCLRFCLVCFEEIVRYLTRQAYIETAIHGQSLYKSGMRAARLLWANLMDTIAIDVVADFVMLCATVFIILVSALVGIAFALAFSVRFQNFGVLLAIGAGIVAVITYFFTQIINIAVETIFICFCEDKMLNDGKDRPYFMSEELKSIIDGAKKTSVDVD